MSEAHDRFVTGKAMEERRREMRLQKEMEEKARLQRQKDENKEATEHDFELKAVRDHYLGGGVEKKRKLTNKASKTFRFDWEPEDDTARNDANPLYNNRVKINALFGRGYIAGMDQREQRKDSNFLMALSERRIVDVRKVEEEEGGLTEAEIRDRFLARDRAAEAMRRRHIEDLHSLDNHNLNKNGGGVDAAKGMGIGGSHWAEKALVDMTERDWRIFREDFDIRIQGGRATLPLRFWKEANFPVSIMRAIEELGYEKPSPIQRQAIPIGQACRDIIGIAETGSGKTAAFTIPLLCYLLTLPQEFINRCSEEGPLAVVMAPTRELAQQIHEEYNKLARFTSFTAICIVGGQSIEEQGFRLRKGVQVVIGTPGRICDCLSNNYMVLNQCNYVVLDEADRMIDMGFEPQVIEVLDAMGGLLKSENEEQADKEAEIAQTGKAMYRVTAMFSATMPSEVERIARKYLRHPAVIKIGDEESGKNKRIEQRVHFITEGQKKTRVIEEIRRLSSADKAIVFVNSKKQGDVVGRSIEAAGFRAGVLHGGKSQDQREDTLDYFRNGSYQVLVATDVAGRGLDIPDVSYVINFDCPSKIESYCHRIGRTGRAGKSGIATTFLTDSDTEIMYDLRQYLEATMGSAFIPLQLKQHSREDEKGNLVGVKKKARLLK